MASAAIQTSLDGIGLPFDFNSNRISAYVYAVAVVTVAISTVGTCALIHASYRAR